MCAKRTNKNNIIARNIAETALYIPVKITSPIKIKFPKIVLKRLTNNAGIANTISHIRTKIAIKPITMSAFFSEKKLEIEFIVILIYQKTIKLNSSRANATNTPAGARSKLFNIVYNFHKNWHQTGCTNLEQSTKKFGCVVIIFSAITVKHSN